MVASYLLFVVFFFNDTATTEIYTLSLHDALPILGDLLQSHRRPALYHSRLLSSQGTSIHESLHVSDIVMIYGKIVISWDILICKYEKHI